MTVLGAQECTILESFAYLNLDPKSSGYVKDNYRNPNLASVLMIPKNIWKTKIDKCIHIGRKDPKTGHISDVSPFEDLMSAFDFESYFTPVKMGDANNGQRADEQIAMQFQGQDHINNNMFTDEQFVMKFTDPNLRITGHPTNDLFLTNRENNQQVVDYDSHPVFEVNQNQDQVYESNLDEGIADLIRLFAELNNKQIVMPYVFNLEDEKCYEVQSQTDAYIVANNFIEFLDRHIMEEKPKPMWKLMILNQLLSGLNILHLKKYFFSGLSMSNAYVRTANEAGWFDLYGLTNLSLSDKDTIKQRASQDVVDFVLMIVQVFGEENLFNSLKDLTTLEDIIEFKESFDQDLANNHKKVQSIFYRYLYEMVMEILIIGVKGDDLTASNLQKRFGQTIYNILDDTQHKQYIMDLRAAKLDEKIEDELSLVLIELSENYRNLVKSRITEIRSTCSKNDRSFTIYSVAMFLDTFKEARTFFEECIDGMSPKLVDLKFLHFYNDEFYQANIESLIYNNEVKHKTNCTLSVANRFKTDICMNDYFEMEASFFRFSNDKYRGFVEDYIPKTTPLKTKRDLQLSFTLSIERGIRNEYGLDKLIMI